LPSTGHCPDGDALLHASPIASPVLGLAVARDVIGRAPLAEGDADAFVARVAPTLQRSVDGRSIPPTVPPDRRQVMWRFRQLPTLPLA